MSTILSMYDGPLAVFTLSGGEAYISLGENTLEAKRQAAIAKAAAATLSEPGAAAHVDYDGRSVAEVLNALLYSGLSITALTATPSQIELGASVNVTLAWSIVGTVTDQTLDGVQIGAGDRSKLIAAVSQARSFVLSAQDANAPGAPHSVNRSVAVEVLPRRFWGSSSAAVLDSAGVIGLTGSDLSATRAKTATIDAGASPGKYAFYAYPASLGAPSAYRLYGFDEAPVTSTISVTTAAGATLNYTVLRSTNALTGSVSLEIA